MTDMIYGDAFFKMHEESSRASARAAIPHVLEFVPAASVVDVGCGVGTWLAEFRAAGIDEFLGIDGDYVRREKLLIPAEGFLSHDLSQPLRIGRRFDLAISLEVAEHLPAESADQFVASLTDLAPVVLFSAAIPHQGGDGHVNEQWPRYWWEKFAAHDYVIVDCLRRRLWDIPTISAWYAQNMLFFVERDRLRDYPRLAAAREQAGDEPPLALVHPRVFAMVHDHLLEKFWQSQRAAMRLGLKLRDINLAAFPEWSLGIQAMRDQLRSLFAALMAHPENHRIAVVIDMSGGFPQWTGNLLVEVAQEVFYVEGVQRPDAPSISAVGADFAQFKWDVLVGCLQGRVVLPQENPAVAAQRGAAQLPGFSLEMLAGKQSLAAS